MVDDFRPQYRLYSPGQIALATLLGSPLAGAVLWARNHRRLKQPKEARQMIVCGVAALLILFFIAYELPDEFPKKILGLVGAIAYRASSQHVLAEALAHHRAVGGQLASWWNAFWIGCLIGLGIILVVTGLESLF